jgi:hypothetical protein
VESARETSQLISGEILAADAGAGEVTATGSLSQWPKAARPSKRCSKWNARSTTAESNAPEEWFRRIVNLNFQANEALTKLVTRRKAFLPGTKAFLPGTVQKAFLPGTVQKPEARRK